MDSHNLLRDAVLTILADKDIECSIDETGGKHKLRLTVLTDSKDVPLPPLVFDGSEADLCAQICPHLLSSFYPSEFVQSLLAREPGANQAELSELANKVEGMLETAADALDAYLAEQSA